MESVERLLIYRLGSLGDTVVALPAFHLIARAFPSATRYLLTTEPSNAKEAHPSSVLDGTGLVHGYLSYPVGLRDPRQVWGLRKRIRRFKPQALIYLAEPRSKRAIMRDALFFKACGIRRLIGVPYMRRLRENKWLAAESCHEYEVMRLGRCISSLGAVEPDDPASWDLCLRPEEVRRADELIQAAGIKGRFLACSPGAKIELKDWGLENWQALMGRLGRKLSDCALALVGSAADFARGEEVAQEWPGKVLNLCGVLSPRESAALLHRAAIFVGHDSGPMHLAAAVGTPCVAIFSARSKPRVWFPYGRMHQVIYHRTDCYGCGLEICSVRGSECIRSITVDEVVAAVEKILDGGCS